MPMKSALLNLKQEVQSKIASYPECKSVLRLIETYTSDLIREISKSITSIQMLLFQRDYSEAVVKLDELKCSCENIEVYHKKGYDIQAQKQIKKSFSKETHSFLSQQFIPGKLSCELIKPRLTSREKLAGSIKKRKDVANGEDSNSNSKSYLQNKRGRKQQNNQSSQKNHKKTKTMLSTDSNKLKIGVGSKDKKDVISYINKTLNNMPSTSKRKIFK